MANHCIEVGCPKCGHCLCLRGCGLEYQVDPETLKDEHEFGDEPCPKCGTQMVFA